MMHHIKPRRLFAGLALAATLMLFAARLHAQELLHEKVFLHINKNVFHAGEIMYFSVSVFEPATGHVSDLSKIVYVQVIDSADKAVATAIIGVENGAGTGSFVTPDVAPGVFRVVAFTNWMKNFSPANYFQKNIAIINARISNKTFLAQTNIKTVEAGDAFSLRVKTDRPDYDRRKKVMLELESLDAGGHALPSNVSISVYRLDSVTGIDMPYRNMLFSDDTVRSSTDRHAPEFRERWVTGTVTYSDGSPAAGIKLYVTVPGYASGFFQGVTNAAGRFRIAVREIIPTSSIIVQPAPAEGIDYRIDIDDPFKTAFGTRQEGGFVESTQHPLSLIEASINAQVGNAYNADLLQHEIPVSHDTVPFFGSADFVYNLDDYTRFSKMEEVFREYIAPVAVNKTGDRFALSVYELQTHRTFDRAPLVLLDGYPVDDINQLFLFDPLKVKTVEVVNRRYLRAGEMFYGIVNMITYSHDLNGYIPSPRARVLSDHVVQRRRQFVSRTYDAPASELDKLPDFRNVLYWEPFLAIDASGKSSVSFWTSDLPGEYAIVVHATAGNSTTSAVARFHVR